jgi:hypothetical protein
VSSIQIPNLTAAVSVTGSEQLEAVQSGSSVRVTAAQIASLSPSGTVTSVNASGGTTGMSFTGGPITSSGTLTMTGTLVAVNGGTGQSSYSIGDILYASSSTALSKLADVATGNALISGGVTTAPAWGKIGLTTHVTGILPSANGGTGVNNGSSTITLGGNLTTSGAFSTTLTSTAATSVTLPISGNLLSSVTAVAAVTGTPSASTYLRGDGTWAAVAGSGTVTSVSVTTANGVSGTVATATTTPAISLTLGAITPTTVNGITFTANATGFSAAGGTTSKTLTVNNTLTLAGTDSSTLNIGAGGTLGSLAFLSLATGTYGGTGVNNGSNTITLGGNISTSGAFTAAGAFAQTHTVTAATNVTFPAGITNNNVISSATQLANNPVTGTPSASNYLRGDGTWATFTTGTVTSVSFTGGIVSVANSTTTPALTVAGTSGGIPYFSSASTWATSAALAANAIVIGGGAGATPATTTTGTGVLSALAVNTGSAGAFVVNGGALGTPSSGTLTSATGLPLTTGVTGILPVANGGTATSTAFTAGSVVFAGASGVYTQNNSNLFWDNTNSYLGIGTATPLAPITITKQITALSGGTAAYGMYQYVTASGAQHIDCVNNGGNTASLNIRTYSGVAYNTFTFNTAGAALQANNSASWTVVSDIQIKQNVRSIGSPLSKINALKPCHYEYKNAPDEIRTGFIAQEFEKVFPGHVSETDTPEEFKKFVPDGEKIKSLDANIVPYLVAAIQELTARLETLEGKRP